MAKRFSPGVEDDRGIIRLILLQQVQQQIEKSEYRVGGQAGGVIQRWSAEERAKNIGAAVN
jgi:hypothetical protein